MDYSFFMDDNSSLAQRAALNISYHIYYLDSPSDSQDVSDHSRDGSAQLQDPVLHLRAQT